MAQFIKKNITPAPILYPIQNNAQSIKTTPTITPTNEQLIFGKYKANLAITETDWIEYRSGTCGLKLFYPPPKAPYSNLEMKEGFRDWKVYEYPHPMILIKKKIFPYTRQHRLTPPFQLKIKQLRN